MSTVVIPPVFQFSELSRNSKAVARATDQGPVTITRRDGEPLVLARQADIASDRLGVGLAAKVMASVLASSPDTLAERLEGPFPWMTFLAECERADMAKELVATVSACASLAQFEPLIVCVHAWQSTAQAYAAGWRNDDHLEWLDERIPVERPA
jgi:hypothetical protein